MKTIKDIKELTHVYANRGGFICYYYCHMYTYGSLAHRLIREGPDQFPNCPICIQRYATLYNLK